MLRNSLARCNARHLRIKRLVQFIFADPIYHNALTNCATRVCCACADPPACVAERYLALRICLGMGAHCAPLRKKKSSAVPLFGAVSSLRFSPCPLRERGRFTRRRKPQVVSFLCPRRAGDPPLESAALAYSYIQYRIHTR